MENLGIFYDHLVYSTAIGNMLWPFCRKFGIFSPALVFWTKKNLATLIRMQIFIRDVKSVFRRP
jgi:hypothetical protein